MPDPTDPKPADDTDAADRHDAAGYDVTAAPGLNAQARRNRGLSDDDPPEREGWREIDADAPWMGDDAYPLEAGDDALDAALEDDAAAEGDPDTGGPDAFAAADVADDADGDDADGGDLMERLTARLEDDPDLAIADLSIELRGGVAVLRGLAATAADRSRAGDLARGVRGVERVENELAADAADADLG